MKSLSAYARVTLLCLFAVGCTPAVPMPVNPNGDGPPTAAPQKSVEPKQQEKAPTTPEKPPRIPTPEAG